MAVVWVFRAAILIAPVVYRVCVSTGCDAQQFASAASRFWDRISDPGEDPATLSSEMTAALGGVEGGAIGVADFTGTFEGRKMVVRWSRAPSGGTTEDQASISMHFVKIATAAPAAWVNGTDDAAVETAFNTFWTSAKGNFNSLLHLDVYRWYPSSAVWDVTPAPYNPAYRTTEVDVAGTSAGGALPPQVAVSVTFKTSVRKRWGRVYLPTPDSTACGSGGRISNTTQAAINTAFGVFLNACTTAHIQPCVMSRAHDAYTTDKGHAIAAQPYTYYGINTSQVDDLFDTIRSRRWSAPTSRLTTTVTPAA